MTAARLHDIRARPLTHPHLLRRLHAGPAASLLRCPCRPAHIILIKARTAAACLLLLLLLLLLLPGYLRQLCFERGIPICRTLEGTGELQ